MPGRLTLLTVVSLIAALLASPSYAQVDDRCPEGQSPVFVGGFEPLKGALGETLGEPTTCQFPDPAGTGDVHQVTTTGLAYWREITNTPSFTNGWDRWALTERGVVHWTGENPDPPPPPPPEPEPAPAPSRSPEAPPAPSRGGKSIVVSLSEQRLWAYQDGQLFLSTPVTTGRPEMPTPPGTFSVVAKHSPYLFRSPFPPGHRFYYEPVWSNYSLRYTWTGYHIHDAPWRPDYGPGTNVGHYGSDGVWRTGSLGCINVPTPAMARLYSWATVGTDIVVRW